MSGRTPWASPMERLCAAAIQFSEAEEEREYLRAKRRLRRAALEFQDAPRGAAGPDRTVRGDP
jgi:hypothetical protein